jgi:hypothetical protein
MTRSSIFLSLAVAFFPVMGVADGSPNDVMQEHALPIIMSLASDEGYSLGDEVQQLGLSFLNTNLNEFERGVLGSSNFTHFEISVGADAFGLRSTGTSTKTEMIAVYRLHESQNWFHFNQTSLVRFDGRNTVNLGFGSRYINDAETVILGGNIFYDYEVDSDHERSGFGVEVLTSMLEFRANRYNAISGTVNYQNSDETALDGHDIKLTANLPYLYSSNVYFEQSDFDDGGAYSVETDEYGVQLEFAPNLVFSFSEQQEQGSPTERVASLTYSIALGEQNAPTRVMQDGDWAAQLQPIRDQLYRPVERENRIMKKTVVFGVTASGY